MSKIEKINLSNFKSFASLEIDLAPLTLLAGQNGVGKSSVIQALLLLRQWYVKYTGSKNGEKPLPLNGALVKMGNVEDVLYEFSEKDELSIGIEYGGVPIYLTFKVDEAEEALLLQGNDNSHVSTGWAGSLFGDDFYFLGAERLGPRTMNTVEVSDDSLNRIGIAGEYAVKLLLENRNIKVEEKMRHPMADSSRLGDNINAWLGEVSLGVRQHVTEHREMDVANLQFSFSAEGVEVKSRRYRATSVGFGIAYTLPVLVALLSSRQEYLVIIENPEAHLHPKGQVAMGELIARAAAAGVQVIVETHSDHVLNGIRLAVHGGILKPEDAALHFFSRESDGKAMFTEVETPKILPNGRLTSWPEGFFDEFDRSLDRLLEPAHRDPDA